MQSSTARSRETEKMTTDLRPGDVVLFADLVDVVEDIEDMGGDVIRVNVVRRGRKTFWWAGKLSTQTVIADGIDGPRKI